MIITAINLQVRDKNRVNVLIDGVYRFSLDISQIVDFGVKVGQECDDARIEYLQSESSFGKIYARALEYCILRPRSQREVYDYLYKKTLSKIGKDGVLRPGISKELIPRVISLLVDKGYQDDRKFAMFWIENRFMKKGVSRRRLEAELHKKGINQSVILECLSESERSDDSEILKIIAKKRKKYDDKQLIAYLARQGFSYDDIKKSLNENQIANDYLIE